MLSREIAYSKKPMEKTDKSDDAVIDDDEEDEEPSFEIIEENDKIPIELPEDIINLTKSQLRIRLKNAGFIPGPFHTDLDQERHKKKLYILEQKNIAEYGCPEELHPIQKIIYDIQHGRPVKIGVKENEKLRKEYNNRMNVKHQTDFYNYFLIDPTKIADLEKCSFEEFLAALIYIGKGTGTRELEHLKNASLFRQGKACKGADSEKLQRIVNIWKNGRGILILKCGTYMSEKQAFFREDAIISALKSYDITNIRSGTKIKLPQWDGSEVVALGAWCVYNAWKIFCLDEHNEMHENNLKIFK